MLDPKPKGRPAAADATPKALKAAQKILLKEGFAKLSIERVAALTGLGKPTLYRRWSNATDLATQALLALAKPIAPPKGAIEAALTAQLSALTSAFATPWGRQVVYVLAASDPASPARHNLIHALILSPRDAGLVAIEAAIASGELVAPPDLDVVLDMLYAPVLAAPLIGKNLPDPAKMVATALAICAKDSPVAPKPAKPSKPVVNDLIEDPRQGSLF